jgi:hypothetical protein
MSTRGGELLVVNQKSAAFPRTTVVGEGEAKKKGGEGGCGIPAQKAPSYCSLFTETEAPGLRNLRAEKNCFARARLEKGV